VSFDFLEGLNKLVEQRIILSQDQVTETVLVMVLFVHCLSLTVARVLLHKLDGLCPVRFALGFEGFYLVFEFSFADLFTDKLEAFKFPVLADEFVFEVTDLVPQTDDLLS
jgi:hypothetical protein